MIAQEELESLYEIKVEGGKVYLRIAPALDEIKADLDEIQEELHDIDADYLPERLLEIYEHASDTFELLCDEEITDYQFTIEIPPTAGGAHLSIHPPYNAPEDALTVDRLEAELSKAGVIQGIMRDVLQKMIDEHIENEPVLVARGRKPVDGKEGYLQLVYGSEKQSNQEEPLQVNHRDMNFLTNVKAGDVLVNIIPPTKGKNGYNVKGVPLPARPGRKCLIFPGRHTAFNADRTQIVAAKAGFVVLFNHKISIENILRLNNIDSSVGNLNFDGIVYVDGNVEDGYTVNATNRIEVTGSVGKAILMTDGEVKVGQGILGATIKAKQSVRASFVSDSQIEAGRNVVVKEYIINSNVSAGKIIHVTDPEGFFHGGVCHGGNFVNISNVGSNKIGDETVVEVGLDPDTRLHFKNLESELRQNFYNFQKTKKNLLVLQSAREKRGILPSEHEKAFGEMVETVQKLRDDAIKDINEWRRTVDIIKTEHAKDGGIVFIPGNIYPGATVKIRRMHHHVDMPVARAVFTSMKGRIQMQDYDEAIRFYRRFF
ncbi:MAG: DUF342 domain-containing protein [SAR324 cluster bacterium]|nr:DUF342 domain-containing protein [SAR324 cluster bacterium]